MSSTMKTLIWIVIGLIIVGGIIWAVYSNDSSKPSESMENKDQLLENGRVTDTEENILAEIDESIGYLD